MSEQYRNLYLSSGIVLMVGAVLIIIFMLHHPTISSHEIADALVELQEESALNAWVHGVLIVLLIGMIFGVSGLSHALGNQRALPRAGLLFFGLGAVAYCLAALVSGFATDGVASAYLEGNESELEIARGLLRLGWELNQAFANAGAVGTSMGIGLISASLALRKGWLRIIGIFGVLVALAPAILLISGHLRLHLFGMTVVAVAQSAWYFLTGLMLVRGRFGNEMSPLID